MPKMNHNQKKLDATLDKALKLLDEAEELVAHAGIQPPGPTVKTLARASSEVLQAREALRASVESPATHAKLRPALAAAEANAGGVMPRQPGLFGLPRGRASFALRTTGDITRMALRLLVPWRLPNIKVGFAETLPALEVQRAQMRITRRTDACQRLFAGLLLAAATVVVGAFYLVWKWTRDLNDLTTVVVAALCAWVVGNAVNMVWCRFRVLVELLRLRYQISQATKLVARPAA